MFRILRNIDLNLLTIFEAVYVHKGIVNAAKILNITPSAIDVYKRQLKNTGIALVLIFLPTLLVAAQPDLGTSILIALSGLFVLFLSGLSWRLIGIAVVLVAAFIPILWFFLMLSLIQI